MAAMQYKPTRMELSNLKKRLQIAKRGHKLMKDKRDELVRRFIVLIRRNKELREEMEKQLSVAMQGFVIAQASMGSEAMEEALMYPARSADVQVGTSSMLSIQMPEISIEQSGSFQYTYGFSTTSAELDEAVRLLAQTLPLMLELAQVEKTCNRLAVEIEKTRRRVNALEYVMIPQFEQVIRHIKMKLDENERGNLTRLMKTKEMLSQGR